MLHPDLDDLIRHIRARGMMAGLITNGYFLVPKRIEAAEPAPGSTSCRSASTTSSPTRCRRRACGCSTRSCSTCRDHADLRRQHQLGARRRHQEPRGCAHDQHARAGARLLDLHRHHPRRLGTPEAARRRPSARCTTRCRPRSTARGRSSRTSTRGFTNFQDNLADGKPNEWRCRAGARYLYICEDGLVHYCSQQRGYPGVPLESYTIDDIRREFSTPKSCAPYCTVGCVHRVSTMDFWRSPQRQDATAFSRPSRHA